jgi:uncharacterized membrane protein YfcA
MKEFLIANPVYFETLTALVAVVAGAFGSLLGLGGGFILIPFLTLVLGVNIRYAIGASLIAVIATSSGAASAYLRNRMANIRVAILLEIGTTLGAITGVLVASRLDGSWLFILFSLLLGWSAFAMFRRREETGTETKVPPDRTADRLRLHSEYPDEIGGEMVPYRVARTRLGVVLMYFAGCLSAMLGIGGGIVQVPAMDEAMRMPMKVSSATSSFMIGVTAATSAGIYFMRGDIIPGLAGPVAFGVLIGSQIGSRWLTKWNVRMLRWVFVFILIGVAIEMGVKGVRTFF